MNFSRNSWLHYWRGAFLALAVGVLSACGGGGPAAAPGAAGTAEVPLSSARMAFGLDNAGTPPELAAMQLAPTYHMAPVFPPVPSGVDADGSSTSASLPPATSIIPEEARHLSTRGLTVDRVLPSAFVDIRAAGTAAGGVSTYSPAQIRAAYGLPAVPSNLSGLTNLQAAQFGAGATIYIIDANHDPDAYSELTAFNQLFGLPGCNSKTLAVAAALPLPAPSANACDFYQVYSTQSGTLTAAAPAYDSGWATEIALDVQWSHAIAPLARIVLIESADASTPGLTGAIQLANRMGPGAVSMSFGGGEGSYVTSLDTYFQTSGVSYFAATGDNGAGVSWPAVSPYVVAVGGTSLSYNGSGSRSEAAWADTGGGISAYESTPGYQTSAVPGMGTPGHRSVADVSFNGDPNHGQYIAVIPNQATCSFCQVSWLTIGGTSLSTPQWAGLAAIVNAIRAQAGKSPLGDPHSLLYGTVADVASNYSADLLDITQGSDGACATCGTRKGYDNPTGLGTPNGMTLVNALAGASIAPAPPVVIGASVSGAYNQPLSFTASISDANPYTLSLTGAPSGMTISSAAVVSWNAPATGSYSVTVTARDSKTNLTGQGIYKITIAPPPPPSVSSGSVTGAIGVALDFNVSVADVNPCTLTLSGAPQGMTISSAGQVSWSKPVAGTYQVTVTALDRQTGLSGKGLYAVAISAPQPPVVSAGSVSGKQGTALSFNVSVSDPNPVSLSLIGAPAGMTVTGNATVTWPKPVLGTYSVTVLAKDSQSGLSGQNVYTVKIGTSTGPSIAAPNLTGVAGKAFSATISITDAGASLVGVGFGGMPQGVSIAPQGGGLGSMMISWNQPVAGNYVIEVVAYDSQGMQSQANVPLTITSK